MCQASPVMCNVLPVTCQNIYIFQIYILKKFGQSFGASRWRVCYQRGLPRLVSEELNLEIFSSTLQPLLSQNMVHVQVHGLVLLFQLS